MNIVVVVLAIVVGFIVIKFVAKVIFKLIGFVIILLLTLYMLFYWNGGLLDLGNNHFMLYELEQKFCKTEKKEICNCIIQPLIVDVEQQYRPDNIEEIKSNKMKSVKIILKSMHKNKLSIKECLKMNDADSLWGVFKKELLLDNIGSDMKKLLDDLH